MKLLIIWGNEHKLHYYEYVKPILDIAEKLCKPKAVHFRQLKPEHLEAAEKVIICGNYVMDDFYPLEKFAWLKTYEKPVLGICAGMQLLCGVYGCNPFPMKQIGLIKIRLKKEFLGMKGTNEVYDLHTFAVEDNNFLKESFDIFAKKESVQALRHKQKPQFGVLFHPESRNKELIREFIQKI